MRFFLLQTRRLATHPPTQGTAIRSDGKPPGGRWGLGVPSQQATSLQTTNIGTTERTIHDHPSGGQPLARLLASRWSPPDGHPPNPDRPCPPPPRSLAPLQDTRRAQTPSRSPTPLPHTTRQPHPTNHTYPSSTLLCPSHRPRSTQPNPHWARLDRDQAEPRAPLDSAPRRRRLPPPPRPPAPVRVGTAGAAKLSRTLPKRLLRTRQIPLLILQSGPGRAQNASSGPAKSHA